MCIRMPADIEAARIKIFATMHLRWQAIPQLPGRKPSVEAVSTTPSMDIFAQLAAELDNEGRYHLLNAAANHLRFPNVHTHYFSSLMLALFGNAQEVSRMLPVTPDARVSVLVPLRFV